MEAKLKRVGEQVKISVNGEIIDPIGYMTYYPNGDNFAHTQTLGNRIIFFGANATDRGMNALAGIHQLTPHYYLDYGKFDFTEIDRIMNLIAPDGKGAYMIPRVYVAAPYWWEKKNPDECALMQNGERNGESFASEKWRGDMWEAIKALIDHINESVWRELVIGYHICAGSTEEWTYHTSSLMTDAEFNDYSEVNRRSFASWLSREYCDIASLNAAWGSAYTDFSEVKIPIPESRYFAFDGVLRNKKREQNVIDYNRYQSFIVSDTIIYYSRRVKEYTDGKLLTGAFYGYVNCGSLRSDKCYFGLSNVINSEYVDFVATTNGKDSAGSFSAPVDSINRAGKLYIYEGDIRTSLSGLLADTIPHADSQNSYYKRGVWLGPDKKTSIANLKRTSAEAAISNLGIWWFDMFGGWHRDPDYEKIIKRHHDIVAGKRSFPIKPEIAYITDEHAVHNFSVGAISILRSAAADQTHEMRFIGAPYRMFLADDLARDDFPADDYKIYIFGMFSRPSDKVREAIENKLKRGGKILIFTSFAGIDSEVLVGFNLTYTKTDEPVQCEYSHADFPLYTSPISFAPRAEAPVFPQKPQHAPRFAEGEENDAYILGYLSGTRKPGILWKRFDSYSAIYSLLPCIPKEILQKIAVISGVHIYSVTSDPVIADGNYINIRAVSSGEKRLAFPYPIESITDMETDEVIPANGVFCDFVMEENTSRLFRVNLPSR